MRVILACDRSAGHVFPAQCLAYHFKREEVYFFIPSYHFKFLLEKEGFRVCGQPLSFRNIVVESLFRYVEAFYILLKFKPQKVVGFGGRDTFFIIFWARIFFMDVCIYEPNIVMGKANRVLSFFVSHLYRGFYCSLSKKAKWSGIPIRHNLKR